MTHKIVYKNPSDLIPYANNARTHSDEQVLQIASSIKEFGFNNPVLLDKDNGIIAGHGRVEAAKKLGLDSIPTICLDHLSDAQRRAYILADNRIALNSGWDEELLKIELSELKSLDIDLYSLGFDEIELSGISQKEIDSEADEGGVNFTIQYNIVFDNTDQQDCWFGFIKMLKNKYPETETVAAALQQFILEGEYGEV